MDALARQFWPAHSTKMRRDEEYEPDSEEHPDFDNNGVWPRRLLHVPTMTSHKWQPGNAYGGYIQPTYTAISYTWGRWRLKGPKERPEVNPLKIHNVKWPVPRIDPVHFTVASFQDAIHSAMRAAKALDPDQPLGEFLWLDIACIDQRSSREAKSEIRRQARIFRRAAAVCVWLSHHSSDSLSVISSKLIEAKSSAGGFRQFRDTSNYPQWCQKTLDAVQLLCKDPWFSSSLDTTRSVFVSESCGDVEGGTVHRRRAPRGRAAAQISFLQKPQHKPGNSRVPAIFRSQ